jgi:3-oxoacyl-[acyl-carrier protein] reductase
VSETPVVLITGTRRGIGRQLADHFLGMGASVEGCSRQPADWSASGYTHHTLDVADEAEVRRMVADIRKRHDRLDVTVNNAAMAAMNLSLLTPGTSVDKIMSINFRGTFLVSRESAKVMKRHNYGRIINMTSAATQLRIPGEAIYASSKAAIEMFTRTFAAEVAALGITCNAVSPGLVETSMTKGVPEPAKKALLERLALGREATFEDVANAVEFFASPRSSYITGQVLHLGGV